METNTLMSGGVGFSRNATASFKYSRNLVKRDEAFDRMKNNPYYGKEDLRLHYPELSPEALEHFRQQNLKQRRRERYLQLTVFIIISSLLCIVLLWILI